jgi:hypothetical protein
MHTIFAEIPVQAQITCAPPRGKHRHYLVSDKVPVLIRHYEPDELSVAFRVTGIFGHAVFREEPPEEVIWDGEFHYARAKAPRVAVSDLPASLAGPGTPFKAVGGYVGPNALACFGRSELPGRVVYGGDYPDQYARQADDLIHVGDEWWKKCGEPAWRLTLPEPAAAPGSMPQRLEPTWLFSGSVSNPGNGHYFAADRPGDAIFCAASPDFPTVGAIEVLLPEAVTVIPAAQQMRAQAILFTAVHAENLSKQTTGMIVVWARLRDAIELAPRDTRLVTEELLDAAALACEMFPNSYRMRNGEVAHDKFRSDLEKSVNRWHRETLVNPALGLTDPREVPPAPRF